MAQSVRERTSELAVLKTLGFSNGPVLALVLAESLMVVGRPAALGLRVAWLFVRAASLTSALLPVFVLQARGHRPRRRR